MARTIGPSPEAFQIVEKIRLHVTPECKYVCDFQESDYSYQANVISRKTAMTIMPLDA